MLVLSGVAPVSVWSTSIRVHDSFYGPGALSWLPAHWVSADRAGRGRFGGPRHIAFGGRQPSDESGGPLAHPAAVPPDQQSSWSPSPDEWGDELMTPSDMSSSGGPVLAAAWDKVSCGSGGKKNVKSQRSG
jgi:hypothetical protein